MLLPVDAARVCTECAKGEYLTAADTPGPLCSLCPPHSTTQGPGTTPAVTDCVCEEGYTGRITSATDTCQVASECCDRDCEAECFHGKCRAPDERAPGLWCNCRPGFSGETCQTPLSPRSHSQSAPVAVSAVRQIACFVVTACGSASLTAIVPHLRRTLRSLRRLKLPEDDREQGVGGLLLFCGGIIDLGLSLWACCGLFACEGLEHSAVLALCFGAAAIVHSQYEFELDPRVLRERIAEFGWLAPAVFVVAAAARIFLVLPSWVFMTVGGLLFGVWGGILWGSVGFTLGAVATFAVARGLGRDALAHRLRGRAARFDRYVSERGAPWLALYTAVPVSLLTPVHFGSGLSGIGLLPFTLAAVCGFIPRTALYSFFGDAIAQNDWSGAGLALGIIVVAGALGIVLARRWRRGRGDESLPASAE